MPSPAFQQALPFVLRWEGGYANHPDDHGGPTNKGITQRAYDSWRARQGKARRDVKLIEIGEVHAIYEADYWLPPRCSLLKPPLDLVQFDTAVNTGPVRSVRFLQNVLGVAVDGVFGPKTTAAAAASDDAEDVEAYCDLREQFYKGIVDRDESQRKFLKGWMNRLNSLRKEAGVSGFEAMEESDDDEEEVPMARVPDFGEDPKYDF